MRRAKFLFVLFLACTAAACSDELLAGGQTARVQGQATDAPAGTSSSAAATPAGPSFALAPAGAAIGAGTIHLVASMQLITATGAAVPITRGATAASVPIAASQVVTLGSGKVEVGAYPRVRVTFTSVEADLTDGIGGSGAVVRVDLPQPLVVTAPVELNLAADDTAAVRVNLNSAAWLGAAVAGVVSSATFQAAVQVTTG
ncbi:MAG TPA: hypothetical protein VFL93_02770 [Longimicrobiaceae bacterium]|jgi:hypothetical protein|nr:hypothetical protein [Longimicrobiaceae bacterium]